MPRTILTHLHIVVPDDDGRDAGEVAITVERCFRAGAVRTVDRKLEVEAVMAEVIDYGDDSRSYIYRGIE